MIACSNAQKPHSAHFRRLFLALAALMGWVAALGGYVTATARSSPLPPDLDNAHAALLSFSPNAGSTITGPLPTPPCEVRGTWLDPRAYQDPYTRATTLRLITQTHLNTLFILAPPVNGNNGWTDPAVFSETVAAAKAAGLSVHAWIQNMRRISDETTVDFRDPDERAAQVAWVLALLEAYPLLDGVHLDYIRYDAWDQVNKDGKMDAVSLTVADIYRALKARYPGKFLTATSFVLKPGYVNFETEDVPRWYRTWFDAHPDNFYTDPYGEGFPTIPIHMKFQQNPVGWIVSDTVDGVMPMQYTLSDTVWNREVDLWGSFLDFVGRDITPIYAGIGWVEAEGFPDWGYDAAGVVRKIKYGRAQGMRGFVIFEIGSPTHEDLTLLNALSVDGPLNEDDAPFAEAVPSCLMATSTPPRRIYLPLILRSFP